MGKNTPTIVFFVILLVILTTAIYFFVACYRNYIDCQTSENPGCIVYSCGIDKSTTNPACVGDPYNTAFGAYRITENGEIQCQGYDLSPVIYR